MIAFEGPEVILGISLEDLKAEINDLSRLGKLLPEGAVKDFTSNVITHRMTNFSGKNGYLATTFLMLHGASPSVFTVYT